MKDFPVAEPLYGVEARMLLTGFEKIIEDQSIKLKRQH